MAIKYLKEIIKIPILRYLYSLKDGRWIFINNTKKKFAISFIKITDEISPANILFPRKNTDTEAVNKNIMLKSFLLINIGYSVRADLIFVVEWNNKNNA